MRAARQYIEWTLGRVSSPRPEPEAIDGLFRRLVTYAAAFQGVLPDSMLGDLHESYQATVEQLVAETQCDLDDLDARLAEIPGAQRQTAQASDPRPRTHRVRSGETLSGIAARYGTSSSRPAGQGFTMSKTRKARKLTRSVNQSRPLAQPVGNRTIATACAKVMYPGQVTTAMPS